MGGSRGLPEGLMQLLYISNAHEKNPVSVQFFGKNITDKGEICFTSAST